jgi:poly(3-hydroxyalkanoate) depolymerase
MNIEMWRPLRARFGGRPTIAFDAPGTGRSDTPRKPLRMRGLAQIVNELLETLGHERVDVLGYSFGGAVAQQLAHDAPHRVRRLILAATTAGFVSLPGSPLALVHMLSPRRYYSERNIRAALSAIAGGRASRDPQFVEQHVADRLASPPPFWGYQLQLYSMTGWTSAHWLRSLRAPTLVMAGNDDPLVPLANAKFLASRIPMARLHVVDGAGHLSS